MKKIRFSEEQIFTVIAALRMAGDFSELGRQPG